MDSGKNKVTFLYFFIYLLKMIERIPKSAADYFGRSSIKTSYSPKKFTADSWYQHFADEHPFFRDLSELESALELFEKTHFGQTRTRIILINSPRGKRPIRFVIAKIYYDGQIVPGQMEFDRVN